MVVLAKFVDRHIGRLICYFLGLFNRKKQIGNSKITRILVIQLWGIGETILTLPAIEALRKKFPKAEINVLATSRNREVYFKNQNLNKVLEIKSNPFSVFAFIIHNMKRYDLAVDMEEYLNVSAIISFFAGKYSVGYSHDSRAKLYSKKVKYDDKQHVVQTFLDLARALDSDYDSERLPRLNFKDSDKKLVEKFLKDNKIKGTDFIVCVAPGAAESAKSRMWPFESYAELCDEIVDRHKAKVIFVGNLNENEFITGIQDKMDNKSSTINSAGKITLNQLFCLISKSKLFVGNDSGPMHIAAAQGVKTLGLFGPNLPLRFGPYGKGNIGLYKGNNCEFSPCINVHKGQVPDCLYPKNSNDYQKCMKNISVNDVLKEIEKMV